MMERPKTRADARAHINRIRKDKGIDTESGSSGTFTDDLEATLKIIAEGLYQQPTRFLLEVLQNADDCSYDDPTPTMHIFYYKNRLRIDYNELGFTERDVDAICKVSSTKTLSADQTGEKGIGFKSVFKIAKKVWVLSGNYSFQFDIDRKLGMITPEWEENPPGKVRDGFTTSIFLEIRGDFEPEQLVQEMKSMSPKHLLFLRKIRRININIEAQDGETWETTLGRKDEPSRYGYLHTTTTLSQKDTTSQKDKTWVYWVYRHLANSLPSEPKRAHCTQSVISLAFPVRVARNSKYEPVIEEQEVYATLPVRNFGFKANAFRSAIEQLNTGHLRYTWPRYMPASNFIHFFQNVNGEVKGMLLRGEFLESIKGDLVSALSVRYVPQSMRGRNNVPLALSDKTESKYLSLRYADSDWDSLERIGVRALSEKEFLDDLERLDDKRIDRESKEWHAQVAKVLTRMYQDSDLYKERIKGLPLIPLSNGTWVSASVDNIFFPESQEVPIPDNLNVSFLHPEAIKNDDLRFLFQKLDIKPLSVSKIQDQILGLHSTAEPMELPAADDVLVAHAAYLFQTGWKSGGTPVPFWVISEEGKRQRSKQVYLSPTKRDSYGKYFDQSRQKSTFLHKKYYQAVGPEVRDRWISWLHDELEVQNSPEFVRKLQELTVKQCSTPDPLQIPNLNDLISQTVFLFRSKWVNRSIWGQPTPFDKFWFITDNEQCHRAGQVYLEHRELQSRQYLRRFRQEFPFLHKEYYLAVNKHESDEWLTWLRESFGIWNVPRLVSPSDHSEFSADFQRILATWPSTEFLMLLSEEWGRYKAYFESKAGAKLRRELGSTMVSCRDGSWPLEDTFTIPVFPENKIQSTLHVQPLLDIPEPDSTGWSFLEIFGVTIKDDINTCIRTLEKIQGSKASQSFVSFLYSKIQEKFDENPEAVK
ncbi:hypothetical protein Hte_011795 [Hypoxylon texense]